MVLHSSRESRPQGFTAALLLPSSAADRSSQARLLPLGERCRAGVSDIRTQLRSLIVEPGDGEVSAVRDRLLDVLMATEELDASMAEVLNLAINTDTPETLLPGPFNAEGIALPGPRV